MRHLENMTLLIIVIQEHKAARKQEDDKASEMEDFVNVHLRIQQSYMNDFELTEDHLKAILKAFLSFLNVLVLFLHSLQLGHDYCAILFFNVGIGLPLL